MANCPTGHIIGHDVRDLLSTDTDSFVGNVVRGWEMHSDPDLIAARQAKIEADNAKAKAYFLSRLRPQ